MTPVQWQLAGGGQDRVAGAPPVVLVCSEAHVLADASSLFVSRLLGTLRDMGNERHRFFLHVHMPAPSPIPCSPYLFSGGQHNLLRAQWVIACVFYKYYEE